MKNKSENEAVKETGLTHAENLAIFQIIARIIWFRLYNSSEGKAVSVKLDFNDHFTTPNGIPFQTHTGIRVFCEHLGWEVAKICQSTIFLRKIQEEITPLQENETAA